MMLSGAGDMSGAFLQCLPSEKPILEPTPDGAFAATVDGNLQFCHLNPDGFLNNLHLDYLSLPPPPCLSSNSSTTTSDDAEEEQQQQQLWAIDERKRRRMISNRESARRSRMRKQKHLDELWSHVVRLWTEKHRLIDRLNQFTECQDRVLQENARLKEEISNLRQMLRDARINGPDAPADSDTGAGLDNIISNY